MTQTIFRANNPCAVRPLARGKWQGEVGTVRIGSGYFSAFKTMAHGVRAGLRCLDTYRTKHKLYSPREIINRWAPPSDNNPTSNYARFVAQRVGVGVDDPIPFDYRHTRLLIEAIMDFELKGPLMPPKAAVDEAFRMMAAEEAAEIGGYPDPYVRNTFDVIRRQPKQRPRGTGRVEGFLLSLLAGGIGWVADVREFLWSLGIYPQDVLDWLGTAIGAVRPMQAAGIAAALVFFLIA